MLETLRRRVRGILGAGAIWGVCGAVGGLFLGLLEGILLPGSGILDSALDLMSGFAAFGLLSGLSFGSFVALAAAREGSHALGPGRGAVLGGLSGLALPAGILSQIPAGPGWGPSLLAAIVGFGTMGAVAGFAYFRGAQDAPALRPADEPASERRLASQPGESGGHRA